MSTALLNALRTGVVPADGLERIATGLEALEGAMLAELEDVAAGQGASKWLRGEYGAGKTFAARSFCARARARGFATAEVQISINDTPLHRLETVYRRLLERLETAAHGANAFRDVIDDWLYQVGETVTGLRGLQPGDAGFVDATEQRLEDALSELSQRNPAFSQALRAYHRAKHEGDFGTAQGLLAWVAGQPHTGAGVLQAAGTRGKVDGQAALTFLSGVLQVLRQSGYRGLVVVLDEVETIQRMRAQDREKALNALRQLVDMLAAGQLPGLYLVVTGTRDFFEGYKGIKALPALEQRVAVRFDDEPRFDNLRAPQVRLVPFDEARLLELGRRVRELFPSERVKTVVTDAVLQTLAAGGDSTPRRFLRELIDVMDRVDQHPDYTPPSPTPVLSERSRGPRATPRKLED